MQGLGLIQEHIVALAVPLKGYKGVSTTSVRVIRLRIAKARALIKP